MPPRARMPLTASRSSGAVVAVQEARVAVLEADHLVAVVGRARCGRPTG